MKDLTEVFNDLLDDPTLLTMDSYYMKMLESFVVLQYSSTCNASSLNEARTRLFSKKLRGLDAIPPTKNAYFQHTKRSLLQASFIWAQSDRLVMQLPSFSSWGWWYDAVKKIWRPFWTDLEDASKSCRILVHCQCKVACTGNCSCSKAGMRCSNFVVLFNI